METKREYYLYRHIRLDTNEPFYIGIGTIIISKYKITTDEKKYKRAYCIAKRSKFWKNIINKTKYTVEILFVSNDKTFIENKEIEFIKLYGRKDINTGSLVNHNMGGLGLNGKKLTIEHKAKIRKAAFGNTNMLGKKHSEETKKLISIAHKGKSISKEHKEILKKRMSGINNHRAMFTEKDILKIRSLYADKNIKITQQKLANMYKTDQGSISAIVNKKKWKINN